ncbi:DUF4148 domain-containing protein [Paraburkholderia panacisoli]|uniref:DUF4148 domain-containing protein n=1 Tax=Paraburkholderia panacisoli TaxID=2603818 RepID=A0A5B0HJ33_9BURK|nr:DUF4148 domain-containing protein [Paraburkholderia panacisoli]KAA1015147.1 DUF4148 domain-containing protein [Paraburkholderia panacisoli]
MRTASFALLFSAAIAAPAFASGYGPATSYRPEVETYTQPSGVTRAQVKADVARARATGELDQNPYAPISADSVSASPDNGPKTRAQVKAELAEARASGQLNLNPNAPAYAQELAVGGYTVPRAQVKTDLVEAVNHRVASTQS